MVYLADVCGGRDNNLNLIRMIAATAVIVSHAWPMTLGPDVLQPLEAWTGGHNLGGFGLYIFFGISGFLIARSFERQPSLRNWLLARFLRLFPALAVVLVLTVLVLGPLVTTLPLEAYFTHPETHTYILRNLTLAFRQSTLPGVFEEVPRAYEVNGPLWTLFYEVLCYAGVMLMGLLGAFRAWRPLVAVAVFYVAANVVGIAFRDRMPVMVLSLLSLGMPFAIGVAFYVARARLPLNPLILVALVAGTVLVFGTPLYQPALMLSLCYAVFVLAYLPGGFVRRYNRLGDYSYGLYIYGWPVQQTAVLVFGAMTPLTNIALAFPVALALAWASWTLVEKPALALVPHSDPLPHSGLQGVREAAGGPAEMRADPVGPPRAP
jgi:peptidoglycan/LPS O-acetylase OafA/YrhL